MRTSIQIKPKPYVDIYVDGKAVAEARVVSEWEGFTKLATRGGDILVVATPTKSNPFPSIFAAFEGDTRREIEDATVLKASPSFIEKHLTESNNEQKQDT